MVPKQKDLKNWLPSVRFEIPSELKSFHYRFYLQSLLSDCLEDKEGHKYELDAEPVQHGGIGVFMIGKRFIPALKLAWFDGNNNEGWKGLIIRSHIDQTNRVSAVYAVAEKFESFFRNKTIPFKRYGYKSYNLEMKWILQSKFK